MTHPTRWNALCQALEAEVSRLDELKAHAAIGADVILRMDIPGLESWTAEQQQLLAGLSQLGKARSEATRACLSTGGLPKVSSGLAERITFLTLLGVAPSRIAERLRSLRGRLRGLRDELSLVTSRNEVLLRQVLAFTDELGQSLTAPKPNGYDATGRMAADGGGGGLLELSL